MTDDVSGVYVIKHKSKGDERYIGSSFNMHRRIKQHIYELRKGTHCNYRLQRIFNKYGEAGLYFEFHEHSDNIRDLEQSMILSFVSSHGRDRLWNLSLDTKCPFDDPNVWAKALASMRENENNPDFVAKRNKRATESLSKLNSDPKFREDSSNRIKKLNADPSFAIKRDEGSAKTRESPEYKELMKKLNTDKMNYLWTQDWFSEKIKKAAAITGANKEIRKHYLCKVRKPVVCLTTMRKFESILEAAKFIVCLGLSKSLNSVEGCIRSTCNGKQKQAYGFGLAWDYLTTEESSDTSSNPKE